MKKSVKIPTVYIDTKIGQWQGVSCFFDVHLGARHCDKKKFKAQLKEAYDNGNRLIFGGDLFDLILPSDKKRFDPSMIDPDIALSPTPINDLIDMAYGILNPYKDSIDFILTGNHEWETQKRHSINPITILLDRLYGFDREDDKNACHFGYDGFFRYMLRNHNITEVFNIYARHGSTGAAPMTGGMLEMKRATMNYRADIYLYGHNHATNGFKEEVYDINSKGFIDKKEVMALRCGTYLDTDDTQDGKNNGIQYPKRAGLPPAHVGCVRFSMRILRDSKSDQSIREMEGTI